MSKACATCTFLFDTSNLLPVSKIPDGIALRCMKEDRFVEGWPRPVRDPSRESCEKFVKNSPRAERWEWDENKNEKNKKKHGISFQDAVAALDMDKNSVRFIAKNQESLESLDFEEKGIQRTFANTDPLRDQYLFKHDENVWLLVSTLRGEFGLITQRVISVRRARTDERIIYQRGLG
ncbi:BrnT family toxin [Pseudomonas neuropathica]